MLTILIVMTDADTPLMTLYYMLTDVTVNWLTVP
jgi:hypothetical protein